MQIIIKTIECVEFCHPGKRQEMLKGAHIIANNMEIYQDIISNTKIRTRISSHYKGANIEEYLIDLNVSSDFLVGLNNDDKAWMQLENTKVDFSEGIIKGAILLILHLLDYLQYQFTQKNV